MLPFHDHHNLLEKSFSEQLELNPHNIPLSPISFHIPEGFLDLPPSPLPPPPPASVPPDDTAMWKNAAGNESFSRRGPAGKDRHTKIYTATGPRDRRMRLSLEVARKFFDLQDMLRFDKASQTVQWLLNKSKRAIRELACSLSSQNLCSFSHQSSESYASECEDVASIVSDSKGKSAMLQKYYTASEAKKPKAKRAAASRSSKKAVLCNPTLTKEWRAKARERARERTREKKRMCCWTNSSTSLDAVEDESAPMQKYYLTPQSLEEIRCLSNSHDLQDYMRSVANYDLQTAGGSNLTPVLGYGAYDRNTTRIFQEQWDMERVLLADTCTYPFN